VIDASRKFVCIRTITYEDAEEARFLVDTFFQNRGELRNVGMCLLSPDARVKLSRDNTGPNHIYEDAKDMASAMGAVARRYPARAAAKDTVPPLPKTVGVRMGLNIAGCDGVPLVVTLAKTDADRKAAEDKLAAVAWKDDTAGKFIYASTTDANDLKAYPGAGDLPGYYVIAPDTYGTQGRVQTFIPATDAAKDIHASLTLAAAAFKRTGKVHHDHVRTGHRQGKNWETLLPVTDPNQPEKRR